MPGVSRCGAPPPISASSTCRNSWSRTSDLAGVLQTLHTIGGWTILVLLVLHIGGAMYHQAIRRDGTLLRMI